MDWRKLGEECKDYDGKKSVTVQGNPFNTEKELTLTLGVLFGEGIAEDLSSVIELSLPASRSCPRFGEPRISI